MSVPILKDLCVLIRKSTIHYNETCEQKDVELTEEFQNRFGKYLRQQNYTVDFYTHSAVISTPIGNYMFVPNQWFVIASYALGVFSELMRYKNALMGVCEYMGEKPKLFIPRLRDETASVDKKLFLEGCRVVFGKEDADSVTIASQRLWRFATDYSWWSGNKTIDRADFYLSVVLNMLSLVAVSQSFVGEIVNMYYKSGLSSLVGELSNFTENISGKTFEIEDYRDPKDSVDSTPIMPHKEVSEEDGEIVITVRSKKNT